MERFYIITTRDFSLGYCFNVILVEKHSTKRIDKKRIVKKANQWKFNQMDLELFECMKKLVETFHYWDNLANFKLLQ